MDNHQKIEKILIQLKKNVECCICLEMLNNPVSTKCGHQYCRFCITEFLKTNSSLPCPLCKKTVTKRSLIDRPYLANAVSHFKKLINAFQMDTGLTFSPNEAHNFTPSTPESIKSRKSSRKRKTKSMPLVDEGNEKKKQKIRFESHSSGDGTAEYDSHSERLTPSESRADGEHITLSRREKSLRQRQNNKNFPRSTTDFLCDIESGNGQRDGKCAADEKRDVILKKEEDVENICVNASHIDISFSGDEKQKISCRTRNRNRKKVQRDEQITKSVHGFVVPPPSISNEESKSINSKIKKTISLSGNLLDEKLVHAKVPDKKSNLQISEFKIQTTESRNNADGDETGLFESMPCSLVEKASLVGNKSAPDEQTWKLQGLAGEILDGTVDRDENVIESTDVTDDSENGPIHLPEVKCTYSRKRKSLRKGSDIKVSAWLQSLSKNKIRHSKQNCQAETRQENCIIPYKNDSAIDLELDHYNKLSDSDHSKLTATDTKIEVETGLDNKTTGDVNDIISDDKENTRVTRCNQENFASDILSQKQGIKCSLANKNVISLKRHGRIVCCPMVKQDAKKANKITNFPGIEQSNEADPYMFKSSPKNPKAQKKKRLKSLQYNSRKKQLQLVPLISKQISKNRKTEILQDCVTVINSDDKMTGQGNINDKQEKQNIVSTEKVKLKKRKTRSCKAMTLENNEEISRIVESISQAEDYDLLTCTQDVHNRLDKEFGTDENQDFSQGMLNTMSLCNPKNTAHTLFSASKINHSSMSVPNSRSESLNVVEETQFSSPPPTYKKISIVDEVRINVELNCKKFPDGDNSIGQPIKSPNQEKQNRRICTPEMQCLKQHKKQEPTLSRATKISSTVQATETPSTPNQPIQLPSFLTQVAESTPNQPIQLPSSLTQVAESTPNQSILFPSSLTQVAESTPTQHIQIPSTTQAIDIPPTHTHAIDIPSTPKQAIGISSTPSKAIGISSTPIQAMKISSATHAIEIPSISTQATKFPSTPANECNLPETCNTSKGCLPENVHQNCTNKPLECTKTKTNANESNSDETQLSGRRCFEGQTGHYNIEFCRLPISVPESEENVESIKQRTTVSSELTPSQVFETQQSISLLLPMESRDRHCESYPRENAQKSVNASLDKNIVKQVNINSRKNKDSQDILVIKYSKRKCFSLESSPEKSAKDHKNLVESGTSSVISTSLLNNEHVSTRDKNCNLSTKQKIPLKEQNFASINNNHVPQNNIRQSINAGSEISTDTIVLSDDQYANNCNESTEMSTFSNQMSDKCLNTNRANDDVIHTGTKLSASNRGFESQSNKEPKISNSELCHSAHIANMSTDRHGKDLSASFSDRVRSPMIPVTAYHIPDKKSKHPAESIEFVPPSNTSVKRTSSDENKSQSSLISNDYISVTDGASVDETPIISVVPKKKKLFFVLDHKQPPRQKDELCLQEVESEMGYATTDKLDDLSVPDIFMMDSHVLHSQRASAYLMQESGSDLIKVNSDELGISNFQSGMKMTRETIWHDKISDNEDILNSQSKMKNIKSPETDIKIKKASSVTIHSTTVDHKASENRETDGNIKTKKKRRTIRGLASKMDGYQGSDVRYKTNAENNLPAIVKKLSAKPLDVADNKMEKISPKFLYRSPGKECDSPKRKISRKMKCSSGSASESFSLTQLSDKLKNIHGQNTLVKEHNLAGSKHLGELLNEQTSDIVLSDNVLNLITTNSNVSAVPDSLPIDNSSHGRTHGKHSPTKSSSSGGKDSKTSTHCCTENEFDEDVQEIVRNVLRNSGMVTDHVTSLSEQMAAVEGVDEMWQDQHHDASSPIVGSGQRSNVQLPESQVENLDMDEDDDLCIRKDKVTVVIDESENEDTDDEIMVRRKTKKNIIKESDDSDDDLTEESADSHHLNVTSSSAFSSQSEVITTQKKEDLESSIMELQKRIIELQKVEKGHQKETKSQSASTELSGQSAIGQTSSRENEENYQSLVPSGIEESLEQNIPQNGDVTPVKYSAIDGCYRTRELKSPSRMLENRKLSSSESDDLFLSPLSPSPPPMGIEPEKPIDLPEEVQKALDVLNRAMGSAESHKQVEIQKKIQMALHSPSTQKSKLPSNDKPSLSKSLREDELHVSKTKTLSNQGKVFVATGLTAFQVRDVQKLAEQNHCKFYSTFNSFVTHVIVKTETEGSFLCEKTLKFFQGIANKCWILDFQWITDCKAACRLLPEDEYEILGDTVSGSGHRGPQRSRLSDKLLFEDFEFYCFGESEELDVGQLGYLVKSCGASVVTDSDRLDYASRKYSIIVTCTDIEDEVEMIEYNRLYRQYGHVTVSREWVLDSLTMFYLQPLQDYVLTCCRNLTIPDIDIDIDRG